MTRPTPTPTVNSAIAASRSGTAGRAIYAKLILKRAQLLERFSVRMKPHFSLSPRHVPALPVAKLHLHRLSDGGHHDLSRLQPEYQGLGHQVDVDHLLDHRVHHRADRLLEHFDHPEEK